MFKSRPNPSHLHRRPLRRSRLPAPALARLVNEFNQGVSLLPEDKAAIPQTPRRERRPPVLNLTSAALFVFTNKRRNHIKLLYFDGTGTWVAAKRLEIGRFGWPASSELGQRRIKLHAAARHLEPAAPEITQPVLLFIECV